MAQNQRRRVDPADYRTPGDRLHRLRGPTTPRLGNGCGVIMVLAGLTGCGVVCRNET
jgi:hypothetical protein